MSKLTLSIDENVVRRAKQFAGTRRTSVSRLVERFLSLLPRQETEHESPVLDQLRGALGGKKVQARDYRRHLEQKYK
jgi:hypothetical protein